MFTQRSGNDGVAGKVVHLTAGRLDRNQDTGRQNAKTLQSGEVLLFSELPVGATFRMWAGRWTLTKNSATTALRTDRTAPNLARNFEGTERCVIV